MRSIASRHNPLVARFRALASDPDPSGTQVLLDGVHLVSAGRDSCTLEVVAVAASRLASGTDEGRLAESLAQAGIDVVQMPDAVFAGVSPVRTPSGIAAIASRTSVPPADLCSAAPAFVLAVVDVQDPGNIGALVRTAEAGGVTGMFVCGASANPFSWKAIRGSMGSALRLPLVSGTPPAAALERMRATGIRSIAAVARGGEDPDAMDWSGQVAIVLGGEGAGLSPDLVQACDGLVSIPMSPHVESLNVGAAGAILIYAARRARVGHSVFGVGH
jgi:TrmH family RNA methyltransferase